MAVYGVALAIPEPYAAQLQQARDRAGDPMAGAIPPHITLLPPTEVDVEELADFQGHLAEVAAGTDTFRVALSGTGTFRPVSPVVFVQVSQGISGCERLERAVRSGPVRRDLEFNYHPHVTIAHNLDDAALDVAFAELAEFRGDFVAERIHLYRHGSDGVWRPIHGYDLRRP